MFSHWPKMTFLYKTIIIAIIKLNVEGITSLSELFRGIKPSKKHRLWLPISLIRLLLLVSIIVTVHSYSVIIAVIVQLVYVFIILYLRQFIDIRSNIIGFLNEVWFTVLLGLLTYFNTEQRWNSIIKDVYIPKI